MLRLIVLLLTAMMITSINASSVLSMDFTIVREGGPTIDGHRFPDRNAIHASGSIVPGDYSRFAGILGKAGRDEFGNFRIYLNSEGGNVQEALHITKLMDLGEFTAIVPDGASCASACASVLFLSARVHYLTGNGQLILHHCSAPSSEIADFCNDAIAKNAMYHGTPIQPVESAMDGLKYYGQEIVVFHAQEACILGLCGPPIYDPSLATPIDLDCLAERLPFWQSTVCSDPRLARYEFSIAKIRTLLDRRLQGLRRSALQRSVAGWRRRLEKCSSQFCLLNVLASRKALLTHEIFRISMLDTFNNLQPKSVPAWLFHLYDDCMNFRQCGRPFLFDRTYERFGENNILLMMLAILEAQKKGSSDVSVSNLGVSDCALMELCDSTIKTISMHDLLSSSQKKAAGNAKP